MVIPGRGLTTPLALSTIRPNKKQKARFAITEINNQDSRKLLNNFKNSPYLGYKIKHVHNEPTEYYLFLIKQTTKLIKGKRHIWLLTNFVNSGANEKIGYVNEKIGHVNKIIQSEELEIINKTNALNKEADTHK